MAALVLQMRSVVIMQDVEIPGGEGPQPFVMSEVAT